MFIYRLLWIVVFLALSSLLPGFLMVECKPVPSSQYSSDPGVSTPAPARGMSFSSRHFNASSSQLRNVSRDEEEEVDDSEDEDEFLLPVITRKYALHSLCSGRNIQLSGKKLNHVRANAAPNSLYAQLTIRSVRPGEISISNDRSQRFLCFNRHGKLIMRLDFHDNLCVFHEREKDLYMVLQSTYNRTWFVGFSRDGRSLQGAEWRKELPKNRGCYNFMKTGEKVFESLVDISHDRTGNRQKHIKTIAQKPVESLSVHKNEQVAVSVKHGEAEWKSRSTTIRFTNALHKDRNN